MVLVCLGAGIPRRQEEIDMRKLLVASAVMGMLSGMGGAFAADLPTRKGPPVAPVYIPPAFSWTGFYVGVNAGYAWDRFLVFATGGLAYGGVNNNGNGFGGAFTATTAPGFINPINGLPGPTSALLGGVTTRSSSTRAGWTIGGGVEYAVWQNW